MFKSGEIKSAKFPTTSRSVTTLSLILVAALLYTASLMYISGIVALLALSVLSYVILRTETGNAGFLAGSVFGGATSVFLHYWMIPVVASYAKGNIALGILCYLATSIVLALFYGVQLWFFILIRLPRHRKYSLIINALLMSALWVLFELVRAELFSSIPSLTYTAGITQGRNLYLIQPAAFGGVYIISFLLILAACFIAYAFYLKQWKMLIIPAVIFLLQFSAGFLIYKNIRQELKSSEGKKFSVALILAGLSPETVWNDESADRLVSHLLSLNNTAVEQKPDLIVWSETVVPWTYTPEDDFVKLIVEKAKGPGAYTLIGMNSANDQSDILCNSVYFLNPDGKVGGRYDKQNLLTLVEKPLFSEKGSMILPFLSSSGMKMRSGIHNQCIETPWGRAGMLLCNESCYSSFLSGSLLKEEAGYLVNMGNDNWFSGLYVARQHFYNDRFRAIENRKDMIINNNMGIAGLVKATGEIAAHYEGKNSGVKFIQVSSNNLTSTRPIFFFCLIVFIVFLSIAIRILPNFKIHSNTSS
ncbi:MAG: apolipoprotein N-acyltransferase [Cytophagaceae bacterium]